MVSTGARHDPILAFRFEVTLDNLAVAGFSECFLCGTAAEITPAIERLVLGYLDLRLEPSETFLDAFRRLGPAPFKALLYGEEAAHAA